METNPTLLSLIGYASGKNKQKEYKFSCAASLSYVLGKCQEGNLIWVRPKKVARLSGLEGVVKQAPTVAK
jgi:hypothetical protein